MSWRLALCVRERARAPDRTSLARAFDVDDDEKKASPVFELGRPETGSTCVLAESFDVGSTSDLDAPRPPSGWITTPWILEIPLLRAPWLARDLLPAGAAAAAAIDAVLVDGRGALLLDGPALIAAWDEAHAAGVQELRARCEETAAPPPPLLPRAELDAVHAWLIALARASSTDPRVPPFLHGLDPKDGTAAIVAARVPVERAEARLPPFPLLVDVDAYHGGDAAGAARPAVEAPRLYAFDDVAAGAPVDAEGLAHVLLDARWRARVQAAPSDDIARYRFVAPVEIVDAESWSG
jgi:hypothetical protein